MNKEFVKKMIRAEMLRYEAIMEILPEGMKNRVETLEKDAVNLIKDIALEMVAEGWFNNETPKQQNSKEDSGKQNTVSHEKKTVKRVNIDFN